MTDEPTTDVDAAAPAAAPATTAPVVGELRFRAPSHTSAIGFSTGRSFSVDNNVLTVPDDLVPAESDALKSYGFTPLP